MSTFLNNVNHVRFGGGYLMVNKASSGYTIGGDFVSVGATGKSEGGVLRVGEKKLARVFGENDRDEPQVEWVESQEIDFEVTLMETSIENVVLALGGDVNAIGFNSVTGEKFYRYHGLDKPRTYPFIYTAIDDSGKKVTLTMPRAEVVSAASLKIADDEAYKVPLRLRLRRALQTQQQDFIVNGSFESGLSGWIGTQHAVVVGDLPAVHGVRSLVIVQPEGGNVQQTVACPSGHYRVVLYSKHLSHSSQPFRLRVGNDERTFYTDPQPDTWRQHAYIFEAGANPLVKITVDPLAEQYRNFMFDSVSMVSIENNQMHGTYFEVRIEE